MQEPNRREALTLVWSGMLVLTLIFTVGAVMWFITPKPEIISLGDVDDFPVGGEPVYIPLESGILVYVVRTEHGLTVFDAHSPRSQCRMVWVSVNYRFEDPCCGSKFTITGQYIEGPSIRHMDTYEHELRDGQVVINPFWHVEGRAR